jgi:hypothetical protein
LRIGIFIIFLVKLNIITKCLFLLFLLDLPPYKEKSVLENKLKLAIYEGNKGFLIA